MVRCGLGMAIVVAAGSVSGQALDGLLTFGYTDLTRSNPNDNSVLLDSVDGPTFMSAGDVTFSSGTLTPDGEDFIVDDSTTTGFAAGTLGESDTAAFELDAILDGGLAVITLTDVDGDQIVLDLMLNEADSPLSFSDEYFVTSVAFVAAGSEEQNSTFDGADGESFFAEGLALTAVPGSDTGIGAVTILPGLDGPTDIPYLVQGFLIVNVIPGPSSVALASLSGLAFLRGRRR